MTRDNHKELLGVLSEVEGKFVLSGYPNKLYDSTAKRCGWIRHEFQIVNNASGKKRKELETECIWTNSTEN
jgi:DNA adenine methylase